MNLNQNINDFYAPLQVLQNLEILNRVIDFLDSNNIFEFKDSSFFDKLDSKKIHYYFALLSFLSRYNNLDSIHKYLRVARHFIENHTNDNTYNFFKLFEYISKDIDIYKFLAQNPALIFHKKIYELESRKAKLILQDNKWEKILNDTSDNPYLIGWVDFLLKFSNENVEKFKEYYEITKEIIKILSTDKRYTLKRALMCIEDFGVKFTQGAETYFYGYKYTKEYTRRDEWNKIFNKPCFKTLLDKIIESKLDIEHALKEIIKNTNLSQKTWLQQLYISIESLFSNFNIIRRHQLDFKQKADNDVISWSLYYYLKQKGLESSEPKWIKYNTYEFNVNNKKIRVEKSEDFLVRKVEIFINNTSFIALDIKWLEHYPTLQINNENINILDTFNEILRYVL